MQVMVIGSKFRRILGENTYFEAEVRILEVEEKDHRKSKNSKNHVFIFYVCDTKFVFVAQKRLKIYIFIFFFDRKHPYYSKMSHRDKFGTITLNIKI